MNLIEFDLEQAKKDPTRVRWHDNTKPLLAKWCDNLLLLQDPQGWRVYEAHNGEYRFSDLRLTAPEPKRVKVAVYESSAMTIVRFADENFSAAGWTKVGEGEIEIREVMG